MPDVKDVVEWASGDGVNRDTLLALALSGAGRVNSNALWCITHLPDCNASWLQEKQSIFIDRLLSATDISRKRMFLQILRHMEYEPDNIRTDFLDFCLSRINAECEPYAVRCFCLYTAAKMCRHYPELIAELSRHIDMLSLQTLSPGLRCARSKVQRSYHAQQYPMTISVIKHMESIKIFLTDVDGTLTDGGMYYTADGDYMKRFNTRDGMGLQLLQRQGVKVGIVTSENTTIVERRAQKLGVDFLVQGKRFGGKLEAVNAICAQLGGDLADVAYIGDDVNCLQLLRAVGHPACPADAMPQVKAVPEIKIMTLNGGQGCVREFANTFIDDSEF